jgi:hypothetical protein
MEAQTAATGKAAAHRKRASFHRIGFSVYGKSSLESIKVGARVSFFSPLNPARWGQPPFPSGEELVPDSLISGTGGTRLRGNKSELGY